ncbi:MAG: N5-glutamine methyltransferase family protein [Acidimicrobiales bacterium]
MGAPEEVVKTLRRAGCVAAEEEAEALWAAGGGQRHRVAAMVERRTRGEPLAWITGRTTFAGLELVVHPGVYVPRWQSEPMARRGVELLPAAGRALDLCTGCGAVAAVLAAWRPAASILATDADQAAVACARANGVDARLGDLDAAVPADWAATVDVLTAVVPYVPTEEMHLLDRDSRAYEPPAALDGGKGGMRLLTEVVHRAPGWLKPSTGVVLVELGGTQAEDLAPVLSDAGLAVRDVGHDAEGDVRYLAAGWA